MTLLGAAWATGSRFMLSSAPRGSAARERFYLPPDPLPVAQPGDIFRSEPMDAYLSPGLRLRARAWRILYRSTGAVGEPTTVSGTILMPLSRARGPRPLVGYAVGTHGIGDACAPSRLLERGLEYEASFLAMILARGWAVALTDYQGLGTPGDHAYMVGRALGPNVLDAIRAARNLLPEELPAGGPAAIMGYSEGGAAAAWAAQLQPSYAPDVELVGVAAGAAAADLEVAEPSLDGTFFSFFMAYGGIGYAAAYPELQLDPYLTPFARKHIEMLRSASVVQAVMFGPRYVRSEQLTQPNVLGLPDWRRRLRENRLGKIAPAAPVLLHHARRDQIVSFDQSLNLRDCWQQRGADVRLYITRGGVDHLSGAAAGNPVAISWLGRRFARAAERVAPLQPVAVPVQPAAAAA
jgi:fermentation-respiration switch protein FrsA (DUF1100 family)